MKNDTVMKMLKVTPVATGVCHGALVIRHVNYPQGLDTAKCTTFF